MGLEKELGYAVRQGLTMKAAATVVLVAFFSMSDVQGADNPGEDINDTSRNIPATAEFKVRKLENVPERRAASWVISQERGWMVYDLEQMVKDAIREGDQRKTAKVAIVMLGKLRAVEAVPLLVENLTLEALYDDLTGVTYSNVVAGRIRTVEDDYPCVGSLIEIGSPAIEPLMKKAEENDDDVFMRLTATVLEKILNPRIAVAYLNDRVEQQNDPIQRKRLSRLLKYIQDEPMRREKLFQSLKPLE